MSPIAIAFGVLLSILGGGLYATIEPNPETGVKSSTALIPAAFGIGLIVCGFIARNEKARKHAMHFAAMLGLVGCVMPLVMIVIKWMKGGVFTAPSLGGQLAMSALCGVFLALCVKSFIDVRKARKLAEASK